MFEQRRVRFKTVYGKFCLNNPKSEYIINNHEKYFTVSNMYKSYLFIKVIAVGLV